MRLLIPEHMVTRLMVLKHCVAMLPMEHLMTTVVKVEYLSFFLRLMKEQLMVGMIHLVVEKC